MISEQSAAAQINRLSALAGNKGGIGKVELREYLRVVLATAQTDHQVSAAITAWIDSQTFPPSPSELRAQIEATPTHAARPKADCAECRGAGRRSFWALISTERWEDSGRIRRRKVEEIPPSGDGNMWLVNHPPVAALVDGINQRVAMLSAFCRCEYGERLRQMATARQEA